MCGLFGMLGDGFSNQDIGFIRNLAYVSGLRGTHGTGVLQGHVRDKKIKQRLVKAADSPDYFLWFQAEKGDKMLLDSVMDNFMIGHVRYATVGALNTNNTHPFDVGRLVGAHNGTLRDDAYTGDPKKTDSELMFEDMNKRGIAPVLKEMDKWSAYAITVFNKSTGEISFARNDKRPLCYAWNTKRRVLYWASEKLMLEFCALRNGLDISKIFSFSERTIYTIKPDSLPFLAPPKFRVLRLPEQKEPEPIIIEPDPNEEKQTTLLIGPPTPKIINGLNFGPLPNARTPFVSDNVVALPKRDSRKSHDLIVNCVSCNRKMDLWDQNKGVQIDTGVYSCKGCEDMRLAIANEGNRM